MRCAAYHLSENLWVDPEISLAMIVEDFSIDLGTAMIVRRERLLGAYAPNGILDGFGGTVVHSSRN